MRTKDPNRIMAAIDITAPREQEGTRAVLRSWLGRHGDRVAADQPLLELETDKVLVEVAAPAAGVLEILAEPGQDVAPGAVLGRIRVDVETRASFAADAGQPVPVAAGDHAATENGTEGANALARICAADVKTSPTVRRLLARHGIDPGALAASGRGGRLTREDVMAEIERRAASGPAATGAVAATAQPAAARATETAPTGRRIPHDAMRRRIAEHMQRSLTTAPHVTAIFALDFSAIAAHRRAHKDAYARRGVNLTFTAYFIAAAAQAMRAVPRVNSRWHDDFLEVFDDVNIGVGTALDDGGLIVPVLHKVQELALEGIAGRLQELTGRARAGKLKPADVQGGTFTLSNHGVSGSLLAAPIVINQPQSAILGIGALEKRVVAVEQPDGSDAVAIRPMAYVSLSIDHRVIDGAQANAWMNQFVATLRDWPAEA